MISIWAWIWCKNKGFLSNSEYCCLYILYLEINLIGSQFWLQILHSCIICLGLTLNNRCKILYKYVPHITLQQIWQCLWCDWCLFDNLYTTTCWCGAPSLTNQTDNNLDMLWRLFEFPRLNTKMLWCLFDTPYIMTRWCRAPSPTNLTDNNLDKYTAILSDQLGIYLNEYITSARQVTISLWADCWCRAQCWQALNS